MFLRQHDTYLAKTWFWPMYVLFLSQLQWSSIWVHLSWPPARYTCSQHLWHTSTTKSGASNLEILEAKWPGLGSEWGGVATTLGLQNHQIWHPMTLCKAVSKVIWHMGVLDTWPSQTAVSEMSQNQMYIVYLSYCERSTCRNWTTGIFVINLHGIVSLICVMVKEVTAS
jgi:hypothetical protein